MPEAIDLSGLALSNGEVLLRIFGAMLIGAIIGTEREHTHRPAGMRTHMLVSLGAAVVMVTSQMIFCQYRIYGATPDPARLSAQVITGVGFLGAGTILRDGFSVKGLTTAASVWAVACLGISMGAGYYVLSLAGTVGIMITLTIFEWLQKKLIRCHCTMYLFTLESSDIVTSMGAINRLAGQNDARVTSIEVEGTHDEATHHIGFIADFSGRHGNDRLQAFLVGLSREPATVSVRSNKKER